MFLSDGSHYDVRHPDLMLVSRSEVVIGLDAGADRMAERNAYLDPIHITSIGPINEKRGRAAGKKRRR